MLGPSKDMIAASSVPIVLSILSQGESYGYDIIKKIRELSGGELEFPEGTLYPILKKLEEKKFIESEWRAGEGGRRRKYYRINENGGKRLKQEKNNWLFMHQILEKLWQPHPLFSPAKL